MYRRPNSKVFRLYDKTHMVVDIPSVTYDRVTNSLETQSGRFRVDFNTGTAWSYGWWAMARLNKARTVLVRNTCGYSMQTGVHQGMLSRILELEGLKESGIKVIEVYAKSGLNNLDKEIKTLVYDSFRYGRNVDKEIQKLQSIQKLLGDKITKVTKAYKDPIEVEANNAKLSTKQWSRYKYAVKKHNELNRLGFFTANQWTEINNGSDSWHVNRIDNPSFKDFVQNGIEQAFNKDLNDLIKD